ncbi:MAG: STAS-like domain-containing protein [Planctomycetaceae bacterium]|nr:STAS-like domain-containing protein [Planctomycetaceae bacterium]
MTEYTIHLARDHGTDLSSRQRAAELRGLALKQTESVGPVSFDFSDVRTVSESFADELLAVLVEEYGEEWFREHIRVLNPSQTVRFSILEAIDLRCRQQSSLP